MPKQMKGGSFKGGGVKGGTGVRKWSPSMTRYFQPRSNGGIAAHGMSCRIETPREAKDRQLG